MTTNLKHRTQLSVEPLEDRRLLAIYVDYSDVLRGPAPKTDITIQSYSLGMGGAGQAPSAGTPSISEIVVTKMQDSASPNLLRNALGGKPVMPIKIEMCKPDQQQTPYMQYELENTLISSFSLPSAQGSSSDRPMESLSLNFTRIVYK